MKAVPADVCQFSTVWSALIHLSPASRRPHFSVQQTRRAARLQVEAKAELLLPILNSGGEPATQMPKHFASVRHAED